MKIILQNVRLAFPQIWTPKAVAGSPVAKFSATFLLDPRDPQIAAINEAIDAVATEKWGKQAAGILKALRSADKVCLHDGNNKSQYDGFEGMRYVNASNAVKPGAISAEGADLVQADGILYAGCYVHGSIEVWAQDHREFGKRINASLRAVKFARAGDAFTAGGAGDASDFDDLAVGASADDFA